MADTYGTITFTKSKDCTFNPSSLIEELNCFNWSADETKWCWRRLNLDSECRFFLDRGLAANIWMVGC